MRQLGTSRSVIWSVFFNSMVHGYLHVFSWCNTSYLISHRTTYKALMQKRFYQAWRWRGPARSLGVQQDILAGVVEQRLTLANMSSIAADRLHVGCCCKVTVLHLSEFSRSNSFPTRLFIIDHCCFICYSHLTNIFTDFLDVWLILLYLLGLCCERKMKFKEFNLELV